MVRKEIAAGMRTIATTETIAAMETMATIVGAFKIFKKAAIIAIGKKIITMVAMTSNKSNTASFNRRKKYI